MNTLRPRVIGKPEVARAADLGGAGGGVKEDSQAAKIIKYIPTEVVGTYLAVTKAVAQLGGSSAFLSWLFFGLFTLVSFVWIVIGTFDKSRAGLWYKKVGWYQSGVAPFAFACWAFALGDPFSRYSWYKPGWASLVLLVGTFLIQLGEKVREKLCK